MTYPSEEAKNFQCVLNLDWLFEFKTRPNQRINYSSKEVDNIQNLLNLDRFFEFKPKPI